MNTQTQTAQETSKAPVSRLRRATMPRKLAMDAGIRIRNIREFMRISRTSLATLTGLPRTTIKNYELNYRKADLEAVVRVSKLFSDSQVQVLAYLTTLTDDMDLEKLAEDYFKEHPDKVNMRNDHDFREEFGCCGHCRGMC
jgi:transcriptional regulator with XRE-family HTH domain